MATLFAFIGGLLKSLYLPMLAYFKGRADVNRDNAEEILDDVKKGNAAAADSSHDDELRDKYGR